MSKKQNESKLVLKQGPTPYGSHWSMAHQDQNNLPEGKIRLSDEMGVYITDLSRLDTNIADPNRFGR